MFYTIVYPPDFAGAKTCCFIFAMEQRAGQRLKRNLIAGIELSRCAMIDVRRYLTTGRQLGHDAAAQLHTVDAVHKV